MLVMVTVVGSNLVFKILVLKHAFAGCDETDPPTLESILADLSSRISVLSYILLLLIAYLIEI